MGKAFTGRGRWTAETLTLPAALLDIGIHAMNELTDRARAVSQALQAAQVPHAVVGGLAVAAHVASVDPGARRGTQDLDLLMRECDVEQAQRALKPLGYRFRKVMRVPVFAPKRKGARYTEYIHLIWTGQKVQSDYLHLAPDLPEKGICHSADGIRYLGLKELLVMKLTSYRLKDQVHIQDLLRLKLITPAMTRSLPADLRARLKRIREITKRESMR